MCKNEHCNCCEKMTVIATVCVAKGTTFYHDVENEAEKKTTRDFFSKWYETTRDQKHPMIIVLDTLPRSWGRQNPPHGKQQINPRTLLCLLLVLVNSRKPYLYRRQLWKSFRPLSTVRSDPEEFSQAVEYLYNVTLCSYRYQWDVRKGQRCFFKMIVVNVFPRVCINWDKCLW